MLIKTDNPSKSKPYCRRRNLEDLDPIVSFNVTAKVSLSQNLWLKQRISLRGDAVGVVKEIIYKKGKHLFITYCNHGKLVEL